MLDLAARLVGLAAARNETITTVESCTGGLIAATITEIAGASAVFDRAFVTYSNGAKSALAGVLPQTIEDFGAVSRPVVLQMAQGGVLRGQADLAIAVSGIAGPDGGSVEKPVGLVHMAACRRDGVCIHDRRIFPGDRHAVRVATVKRSLELATDLIAL
jgi:nicotinamide-nucleotide amidase